MKLSEFEEALKLEFEGCLKKFPELDNVELMIEMVEEAAEIAAIKGHRGNKQIVVLIIPVIFLEKNIIQVFRPFIFHELSHMIDKENPDGVFFERADAKSQELWRMLKEAKALNCKVEE